MSGSDLPYPEGIAAAEGLRTGQEEEGGHGLRDLLGAAAAAGTARLAQSRIGGFTGDVAGACQQACEVAFLIGLLVAPGAA